MAVLWRYSGQIALCTDASTRTPWVKYTLAREKFLFGRKVVRLKPDQPDRRLRPCNDEGFTADVSAMIGRAEVDSPNDRDFLSYDKVLDDKRMQ